MRRQLAILVWIGAAAAAGPAQASAVELEWTAPAGCPSEAAVGAVLERRLSAVNSAEALAISAQVQAVAGGYRLKLHARAGELERERELQAADCEELVQATLLIAALLADVAASQRAGAAEPAVEAGGDPESPSVGWYARAHWLSDLGALPELGFGPGFAFGLAISDLRFELGALYLLPQPVHVPDRQQQVGSLRVLALSLGACHRTFHDGRFALGPCAGAEYGRVLGESENVTSPAHADAPWVLGWGGLRAEFEITADWAATLALLAGLPFDRARFEIEGLGKVHELPAVLGRLQAGLEWRF
jgi:hypothetical protein